MNPHDILIVGGGFAGFWAAVAARRVLRNAGSIGLVSRAPGLQLRPRLYESGPESLSVDLRPLLAKVEVEFIAGDAKDLQPDRRTLVLGDERELGYQRLIVAVGSEIRRPPIPGSEHAFTVDRQADAIELERELRRIAGLDAPRIAVIGAGFTGIEVATELRDRVAGLAGATVGARLGIVLVDRAPTAGPELGPEMQQIVAAALSEDRIELCLGVGVAEIDHNGLSLIDGRQIAADLVVLTTGMAAAGFVGKVPGARDSLGRIVVDPYLRAPAVPDVFVTGDAAAADTGDGHMTLQSCQHALQLGRFAGENAARDLLGQPTTPYRQERYVTCLDLGRSGAVLAQGWDRRVVKTGAEGKQIKRMINSAIAPPTAASAEELIALSETGWRTSGAAAALRTS